MGLTLTKLVFQEVAVKTWAKSNQRGPAPLPKSGVRLMTYNYSGLNKACADSLALGQNRIRILQVLGAGSKDDVKRLLAEASELLTRSHELYLSSSKIPIARMSMVEAFAKIESASRKYPYR